MNEFFSKLTRVNSSEKLGASSKNKEAADQLIKKILFVLLEQEGLAFDERDCELTAGVRNDHREKLLYYPSVRSYVETQDSLFELYLPQVYEQCSKLFTSVNLRWRSVVQLAGDFQDQLQIGSPEKGGIVDCRAKSLFSTWLKMKTFRLDRDEIFDLIGVRITVKDVDSARNMYRAILKNHELMRPHEFRHREGEVHSPFDNSLAWPRENGYGAVRMNLLHPDFGIYEVQIQSLDLYQKWRIREKQTLATLGASPKYGAVLDPD